MEQPTSKTPDRKSALKTVTKKGITVNPKKEDLMKETMKAKPVSYTHLTLPTKA